MATTTKTSDMFRTALSIFLHVCAGLTASTLIACGIAGMVIFYTR